MKVSEVSFRRTISVFFMTGCAWAYERTKPFPNGMGRQWVRVLLL